MRITAEGRDYQVAFEYDHCNTPVKEGLTEQRLDHDAKAPNLTTCVVKNGNVGCSFKDMAEVARGQAVRSRTDQFCKETGRKVALGRALAGFGKKFRSLVWKAYRERK